MKSKRERMATVRTMIKTLKARRQDAKDEIRVLESALTFYIEMLRLIEQEGKYRDPR